MPHQYHKAEVGAPQLEGVGSETGPYSFTHGIFKSSALLSGFPNSIILNNRIIILSNEIGLTLKIYCTKKRFSGYLMAKYLKRAMDS